MSINLERQKQNLIAKKLIDNNNIKIVNSNGKIIFRAPDEIEKQLKSIIGFSLDKLTVGGNVSLSALAAHINQHPAQEAYIASEAEKLRYALEIANIKLTLFEEKAYAFGRKKLLKEEPSAKITEKQIKNVMYMNDAVKDRWLELKFLVSSLEFKYRLMNNVIRSALQTKGVLLPTLRNLVQGKSQEMEPVIADEEESEKIKLGG